MSPRATTWARWCTRDPTPLSTGSRTGRGVFLFSGHSRKHLVATKEEAIDVLLGSGTALSPTPGEIVDTIMELQRLLRARSDAIDSKISRLQALRLRLDESIGLCEGSPARSFSVLEGLADGTPTGSVDSKI